ncbi:putative sugar transporter [Xylariales sp. PMI_506]|nr:putative sugar transporter [Xylariales sp. PMI_506]
MRNPFAIEEDPNHPVPREILGWRVYAVALAATWASAMYGYCSAFIGGTITLPAFETAFGLTTATATSLSANIVSTFQGGAFFGAIFGTFFSERFGRKWTVTGSGVLFVVGVVLHFIQKIGVLYVGRVITGLGVGATTVIIPVYIAECSPAPIRGRLVGIFEIMLAGASLCGFWVNYGVEQHIANDNNNQWYIPVAIQLIPAGLLILTMPFSIESPRWLISQNRHEAALKALSWVRNLPADHEWVRNEVEEIQSQVTHEAELSGGKQSVFYGFTHLADSSIRNRILTSMALMLLQNLTGINALNYYSPTIFSQIGYSGSAATLLASGVYGVVKFVVTLVFMIFIVDSFGRRVPLIAGGIGCAVCMLYLGGYTLVSNSFNATPPRDSGANAAIASLYLYAVFYSFSWSGIPWIFSSEVLPTHVRGFGMMCAGTVQWLAQFIVVYSLPYMVKNIKSGMFFFFGACAVVAFIFAYLFVPETKGVVLEDMELLFAPTPVLAPQKRKAFQRAKESGFTGNMALYAHDKSSQDGNDERIEEA